MTKYKMSSCGQFKQPVEENLCPAIQDKDWRFVGVILQHESHALALRNQIMGDIKKLIERKK